MKPLLPLLFACVACAQTWVLQTSNSTASLRAVSAVNANVVWASGTGGTYLRTTDGGTTWTAATVPGAESLDFRGLHALNDKTAYLMSSGSGDKSRVYKTTDGGAHWTLLFTNPDAQGFFDSITFTSPQHGIIAGDAVNGEMTIFTTDDGGTNWTRRHTPPALPKEGAFAASNSCLTALGNHVWFATGGPGGARVLHSKDGGVTWTVSPTPIRNDGAAAGIFSLAFSDAKHGIAVGGDYSKDAEPQHNIAITSDGGSTWHEPARPGPKGFRSAAIFAGHHVWLTTGTSGSDLSSDDGKSWKAFDSGSFNALSAVYANTVWAVGAKGHIARLTLP